jgi:hypothetical protein
MPELASADLTEVEMRRKARSTEEIGTVTRRRVVG